jgi:MFS family permease
MMPSEVGLQMGLIFTVGAIGSSVVYGYIVDRQFSRGRIDFVLRANSLGTVIATPLCFLGFTANQHSVFIAALIADQCALVAALGPGIAAIQMVTPPEMRGRMAALIIVVINLAGYGGGPLLIGALTEFFFSDPQQVGLSIALTFLVLGPIAAWSIWSARPRFVARVIGSAPAA